MLINIIHSKIENVINYTGIWNIKHKFIERSESHGSCSYALSFHCKPPYIQSHYFFQILRCLKGSKEIGPRLNDLGRRLTLFGIACLFSLNFLQSSIIGAVLAWAVMILMLIAHCFVFIPETSQKFHNMALLVYYMLLTIWFGVIVFTYL